MQEYVLKRFEEFRLAKIRDYAPDVVCYSVTTGMHLYFADINRKVKQVLPDVLSVFAGLRPLVTPADDEETAKISRDHTVLVSESGLITITGGKSTEFIKTLVCR